MGNLTECRIAWLLPAMGTGGISFQHLLCEFTQHFPQTRTFTGQWPGFAAGYEHTFQIQEVGSTQHIRIGKNSQGYEIGFSYASPEIVKWLLQFKPNIVFANAFSVWTLIALLLKPIGKWKVIITYEGGSPSFESYKAIIRLIARRWMVKIADAYVVNGKAAENYFVNVLQAKPECLFSRPFLVPSLKALMQCPEHQKLSEELSIVEQANQPIFLFVGQIIPRKGLKVLLEACLLLKSQGYQNYTLLIVGEGEQRSELEAFVENSGIQSQIKWLGQVAYRCMGLYFQQSDVFVFPTNEDIWGMVLTEAMGFGKPVLCSTGAGAVELVVHRENGFVFDPENVADLAKYMCQFIDNPDLIEQMGQRSAKIMQDYSPEAAVTGFTDAIRLVYAG